jgi:hypothetical protein
MRTLVRSIPGASLIALTVGLVLAARPVRAQAPVAGPAPAVVPRPATPPSVVYSVPPGGYTYYYPYPGSYSYYYSYPGGYTYYYPNTYATAPQSRVYTVPSQGGITGSNRHHHYGYWPARRELFLAKPWLKPD